MKKLIFTFFLFCTLLSNAFALAMDSQKSADAILQPSYAKATEDRQVSDFAKAMADRLNEQLFAAVSGKKELPGKVMVLLAQGADPDIKKFDPPLDKAIGFDNQEDTPLHIAIRNGYLDSAGLLLNERANARAQNINGETPLHEAVWLKTETALKAIHLLHKYHADFDAQDEDSNTPLHIAIQQKKFVIADQLIKLGAHVNKGNRKGNTPLHVAIMNKNIKGIVYLIIKHNAQLDKENNAKKTPLMFAFGIDNHKLESFVLEQFYRQQKIKMKINPSE